jgi:flagellin
VSSAAVIGSFNFADSAATASVATVTGVAGFDYSGTAKNFTIDGNAVAMTTAYANQGAMVTDVQSQLDTAAGAGVYTVAADGATGFTITTTATGAGSAIAVGGADASFVTSNVAGSDAVVRSKSFSIDGNAVTLNTDVTNMAGLISAINTALGGAAASYSLADDGTGKLKIDTVATGSSATISITGTDAAFFGAATAGTDAGAPVSLTLGSGDLTLKAGSGAAVNITGTFANAQALADGINAKGVSGVSAYVDSVSGKLQLTSQEALTVGGS